MTAPDDFQDEEIVVRVLKTPQFVRHGKLVSAAFRPQRETPYLSVIRWLDREDPDSAVKLRCKSLSNERNQYCGVATILAKQCFDSGVTLEYAPEEYPGHSHIRFPYIIPRDEPPEGENFVVAEEIAEALRVAASYILDPDVESNEWTIPEGQLSLTRRSG